jgi:hypothetical protein
MGSLCGSSKGVEETNQIKAGQVLIVAVSGGLRKASCTTGLVRAAVKNAPSNVVFKVLDISKVPLFN